MLVLTRKLDQSLVIDGNVIVTVLSTEGGRVRLGITAPAHVSVRRAELAPLEHPRRRSDSPREPAVLSTT